ncbi:MAG: helix-turn-helix domain-containing protein [Neptuniibacter sp.]
MQTKREQAAVISRNIKELRKTRGWNQAQLAAEAKISAAALSKIEQGEQRVPTIVVLRKIAGALCVEIHDITGEKPQQLEDRDEKTMAFFRKFGVMDDLDPEDQQRLLDMAKRLKDTSQK